MKELELREKRFRWSCFSSEALADVLASSASTLLNVHPAAKEERD